VIHLLQKLQLCKHLIFLPTHETFLLYAFDGSYLARTEAFGFVDTAISPLSDGLLKFIKFPNIFLPQLYEILLANLDSSITIAHILLSHHKLLDIRLELSNIDNVDAATRNVVSD
jgi:hypothetical protein